ncbi:MAG: hypothetical protein HY321_06575 [Armatimonadetes bacterium]|nr:hypothetical protein [Armatimonadota bacterium]
MMERLGWTPGRDHRGGAGRKRPRRGALLSLSVLLAGAVLMGGCGSGALGLGDRAAEQGAAERTRIMMEVFDILDAVEMKDWGDYGRMFWSQNRIRPMDFSAPENNPFGVSRLDGAANFADGNIYIDQTVWLAMPPRHLAIVMLDEMIHFRYMTTEHDIFNEVTYGTDGFVARWTLTFGRHFNALGPEDAAYQEWWDNFLLTHEA